MTPPTLKPPVTPRDAAAMILLREPDDPKVFWVKRSYKLAFMGGFHAFPGGQLDAEDAAIPLANCPDDADAKAAAIRVCAIREIFEETGVLLAHGAEAIPAARRVELRQQLHGNQISFKNLLTDLGLSLDAAWLTEAPRWCTPASSPRRYDTRFFTAWLPEGQETDVQEGELASGEWLRPHEALQRWTDGGCLIVTPILTALLALAEGAHDFAPRLHNIPQDTRDLWEQRIEMRQGFFLSPLRTPTIPPATHTNCYIVGGAEQVIIDPGSPYPDEQARLDAVLESLLAEGRRFREIIITHLHPDHIGDVMHVAERFNLPVATHRLTADALNGEARVDRLIEDNELIVLRNQRDDLEWRLRALWTPGHARGHLSFHEERTGTLLTGDCVVGFGTVVIAPPEGNLNDYLASLRRYLALPKLTALMPGHGPVLADARGKIEEYLAHRQAREDSILAALAAGPQTIPAIVATVYTDTPPALHQLAELSVQAHLEKLAAEGRVSQTGAQFALS
ncbi:MAG: MBL fold metallo-hydrolase [Acidobacteria bacterium]|nr:MBL fold metallo-hydrolase [Acidobacteriota bacterium]MBI3425233.1 MBL fold metallo-hydrolase [Acidobacteriota bacterium]